MNPTKITEVKAVAKKRQENFKKQGKEVKLGLCLEIVAKERGYKNWRHLKAMIDKILVTEPEKTTDEKATELYLKADSLGMWDTARFKEKPPLEALNDD